MPCLVDITRFTDFFEGKQDQWIWEEGAGDTGRSGRRGELQ